MDNEELQKRFKYYPPDADQPERYKLIRSAGFELASVISSCAPESRERSIAITKVEEAVMWANAAIARNE